METEIQTPHYPINVTVQSLVHGVKVAGGKVGSGKGIRSGQGGRAPHVPESDGITSWVCCNWVYHMTDGNFMPGNTISSSIDEVNDNKRDLTSDSEISQPKLNKLFEERKRQVLPVHLFNVLGKSLNELT